MLIDLLGDLNWVAVIVASLAWYVWSAIWYSNPPISKAWIQAARVTPEGTGNMPPPSTMIGTLIGYFVTTIVIALLVGALGPDNMGGLELGVLLGIGFGFVPALITQMYEQKGSSYWWINGIGSTIAWVIVCVILVMMD